MRRSRFSPFSPPKGNDNSPQCQIFCTPPRATPSPQCQIILTASEMKRKNDIYVMMVSNAHQVAAKGKYIAIVSTVVEGQERPEQEIKPALKLLGKIEHIMCTVGGCGEGQGCHVGAKRIEHIMCIRPIFEFWRLWARVGGYGTLDSSPQVSTTYQPVDNGEDGVHVSSSYDATSHFESASTEVMAMWRQIHGSDLELTVHKDAMPEGEEM